MHWDVVAEVATALVPLLLMCAGYVSWYLKINFKALTQDMVDKLDERYVRKNGGRMTGGEIERRVDELERRASSRRILSLETDAIQGRSDKEIERRVAALEGKEDQ